MCTLIAVRRLCAARYCIDQTAIDQSVRRLPIFVVASKKMLVLLGSSYAARCWCMLELFTFIRMGGDPQRVTVLPVEMDEDSALRMFHSFDISKAAAAQHTVSTRTRAEHGSDLQGAACEKIPPRIRRQLRFRLTRCRERLDKVREPGRPPRAPRPHSPSSCPRV